jgi:hypothetical protein
LSDDDIDNLSLKKNYDLEITAPSNNYVENHEKYITISGKGAIPGCFLILISSLDNKYLSLQKGNFIIRTDGTWQFSSIYLKHEEKNRLIYALTVSQQNKAKVKKFIEDKEKKGFCKEQAIEHIKTYLVNNGINDYQISPGKTLIRKRTSFLQKNNENEIQNGNKPFFSPMPWRSVDLKNFFEKSPSALEFKNYGGQARKLIVKNKNIPPNTILSFPKSQEKIINSEKNISIQKKGSYVKKDDTFTFNLHFEDQLGNTYYQKISIDIEKMDIDDPEVCEE